MTVAVLEIDPVDLVPPPSTANDLEKEETSTTQMHKA
jgi:hypothetical protein